MSESTAVEAETVAVPAPKQTKRSVRKLARRTLYTVLIIAILGLGIYLFLAFRRERNRLSKAYLEIARVALKHDQFEKASEAFENASKEDPSNLRIRQEQLRAQIFQIADESDSLGRQLNLEKLDDAEKKCQQLLNEDRNSAELTALLGIIYAHKDQPILAMQTYEKAAGMAPNYANVRNYWGYSASQWHYPDDWEKLATDKFNEAISLDQNYAAPRINLARLDLRKKNYASAIDSFKAIEKIEADDVLYTMWGIALDDWARDIQETDKETAFRKFAEALDKYRQAEAINPSLALIHYDKANALGDQNDKGLDRIDDAIREYRRAIELDSTISYAYAAIADLILNRPNSTPSDYQVAATNLEKAIDLTKQTLDQYTLRKKSADSHAQKMLDIWAKLRNDELSAFKHMLEDANKKLNSGQKNDASPSQR